MIVVVWLNHDPDNLEQIKICRDYYCICNLSSQVCGNLFHVHQQHSKPAAEQESRNMLGNKLSSIKSNTCAETWLYMRNQFLVSILTERLR